MAEAGTPHRLIEVPASRLPGWVDRFQHRHGTLTVLQSAEDVVLAAADGAIAAVLQPFPGTLREETATPEAAVQALLAATRPALDTTLLLIRRGGYAVGVTRGGRLTSHKVGTRYVQGKTAAGGWSQQRFARRRSGQTAELVKAATDALLAQPWPGSRSLTTGGDVTLVSEVLADRRLAVLAGLPRGRHLEVGDPRLKTLQEGAERATSVQIKLNDAAR